MARQLTSSKLLEDELRTQVFALQQHKDALLTDAVVLKDVISSLESDLATANSNRVQGTAKIKQSSTADVDALVTGVGVSLAYEATVGEMRTELEVERQRSRQLAARLRELELQHEAAQQKLTTLQAECPEGLQKTHEALERQHRRTIEELEARLQAQSIQLTHARKQATETREQDSVPETTVKSNSSAGADAQIKQGA